jgi:hypothetical protein
MIQIYDSPESDLKLNDVFEFIGVLTFDSEVPVDKDDHDELSNGFSEDALAHLPPNKVLLPCYSNLFLCLHCRCCWHLTVLSIIAELCLY